LCAREIVGAHPGVPEHMDARRSDVEDQVQSFGSSDNSSERSSRVRALIEWGFR